MIHHPSEMDAYRLMKTCPQFNTCSAPSCPLDLNQAIRPAASDEPQCKASRSTRLTLALGHHLPHAGLTHREVVRAAKRKRWMEQPQDVRDAILNRLTIARTHRVQPPPAHNPPSEG